MNYRLRTLLIMTILSMLVGSLITLGIVQLVDISGSMDRSDSIAAPAKGNNQGSTSGRQPESTDPEGMASSLKPEEIQKFLSALELIEHRFYDDVEPGELLDGAIQGMLTSLGDPYSVYMNAAEAERFQEHFVSSSFTGIGAEVSMRDGHITVVSPIRGSPAEKAGIRTEDIILSVNGEDLDGLSLNDAVLKIRGPKGTKASLEILRGASSAEPIEIVVVRDDIEYETVHAEMLDDSIGKIEIRQFAQPTITRFAEELEQLESEGMKGLIVDLRSNPGGLLFEVVQMVQPFVPEGEVIVQVEDRKGQVQKTTSKSQEQKSYPVAVLTDRGSASAAEIFAGAIQDHNVGVVIGETTFGKGTVQSTFPSGNGDGSNIKMTIAKWLTPKGRFIEGEGIVPDIEVAWPELYHMAPIAPGTELQFDDNNSHVQKLQLMLEGVGYNPGRTDGYFNKGTEQAIKKFQADHSLPVTGVFTDETAEPLQQNVIDELMKQENDLQLIKAIEYLRQQ